MGEKHINRDLIYDGNDEWNSPTREDDIIRIDNNILGLTFEKQMNKAPNEHLQTHLDTALMHENYELAQHIKDLADKRGFELKQ